MNLAGHRINREVLESLPAADRKAVEDDLLLLEAEFKRNPLLSYRPHPKQAEFHSPPFPPGRWFFGGNRSGKTTAVVIDSIIQAIDAELVPDHLRAYKRWGAPFFCRFVTPDLTNTLEGVVLQKLRDWCPRSQLKGESFDRAWDKQLRILRFKNGSWFQFFSNDQDRDKFGGAALHRVVFDEEPREDIRQECLMRLIDFGGEELFAMTPFGGMNWLYSEVFEPWEEGVFDGGRVVLVDMDDNPHLNAETKRRVLQGLSSEERQARKAGRFVHFAGLIYHEFSRSDVIPQAPVPDDVEVFAGIDPGLRHPAVLFAYLDADDCLVVFDEIALPNATIATVCKEIHRRNLGRRRRSERGTVSDFSPRWYVIDPASRNRNSQTGRSDQDTFAEHKIFTMPGQNDVSTGINKVKERLEAGKLKVMANCTELQTEFKRYRWQSESTRTESDAKERPVKKEDHLLDCLRYVCMARPLPPVTARAKQTETQKDRLLRESLKALRLPAVPAHDSGPGIWL